MWSRCEIMGKNRWEKILCVDYGCTEEEKTVILNLCEEYPFVEYMTVSAFAKQFSV